MSNGLLVFKKLNKDYIKMYIEKAKYNRNILLHILYLPLLIFMGKISSQKCEGTSCSNSLKHYIVTYCTTI